MELTLQFVSECITFIFGRKDYGFPSVRFIEHYRRAQALLERTEPAGIVMTLPPSWPSLSNIDRSVPDQTPIDRPTARGNRYIGPC